MTKSKLFVTYWILKSGKPFRHFLTKADRALYLKSHKLRAGRGKPYSLKDIVKFTMAE